MAKKSTIPTERTLAEFKRLYKEAGEVTYSHDEFLQLIFSAAVKLYNEDTKKQSPAEAGADG